MVTLQNSWQQQENQEIWLKNGELSRISQDSLKIHGDISIGNYNHYTTKTELDLCGFYLSSIFINPSYFMLWLRTVLLLCVQFNFIREGKNDWTLEIQIRRSQQATQRRT